MVAQNTPEEKTLVTSEFEKVTSKAAKAAQDTLDNFKNVPLEQLFADWVDLFIMLNKSVKLISSLGLSSGNHPELLGIGTLHCFLCRELQRRMDESPEARKNILNAFYEFGKNKKD